MRLRQKWGAQRLLVNEAGATLVEMLVFTTIMGLLASIAVIGVSGIAGAGLKNGAAADRHSFEVAEEAFFAKSSASPQVYASESELVTSGALKAASGMHDVCLTDGEPGPPAVPAGWQFEVIEAGASCSPGYSAAP